MSATIDGTATAKMIVPSRIFRLTGYTNTYGTVSYARSPAEEKNKITGISVLKPPNVIYPGRKLHDKLAL